MHDLFDVWMDWASALLNDAFAYSAWDNNAPWTWGEGWKDFVSKDHQGVAKITQTENVPTPSLKAFKPTQSEKCAKAG